VTSRHRGAQQWDGTDESKTLLVGLLRAANDLNTSKYKSEDSDLELPLEGALYVHPGLRLGLNVTEKRTGADDNDDETEPLF
jgi:hypothetical protein